MDLVRKRNGFKDVGVTHHFDISHTLGNCMKRVYVNDPEFEKLTGKLGKIRLQCHLTDKAWLLPPNMRSIARFMNLQGWVEWVSKMLACYASLDDDMKKAYAFLLPYRELVEELGVCINAIRHVEGISKNEGLGKRACALCRELHH